MVLSFRQIGESEASDRVKAIYEDTRIILAVPWVGIIIKVFANYPKFLNSLWLQVKKSAGLHYYELKAEEIQALALRLVSRFALKDIRSRLESSLTDAQIQDIEELLDVFNYGNPKFLILAAVGKNALEERQPRRTVIRRRWRVQGRYVGAATPPMIQENETTGLVKELYSDIRSTLKLPFVNSDYKALANWPTFLNLAWKSLKPNIGSAVYSKYAHVLQDFANEIGLGLPYPVVLSKKELTATRSNKEFESILETVKLFYNLLPGLILNVASFKLLVNPKLARALRC